MKPDSRGGTKRKVEVQVQPEPVVEKKEPGAIYERAVYIFPYKSHAMVQKLQQAVAKINLEGLGSKDGNTLLLTTKSLTEEEKKNPDLDIITGFAFIDKECRTYMLEGLGAKGMKRWISS